MSENNVTRISVLGSTGSVGEQALDVAAKFGYEVCALSANKNSKRVEDGIVAAERTFNESKIPMPPLVLFSLELPLKSLPNITGFSSAFSSKATKTTSPTTKLLNIPGGMFTRASASTGAELEAVSNKGILTIQRFPAPFIDRIIAFVIKINTSFNLIFFINQII